MFLVACYATLHPALSVHPSVRPSVRPSVTLYFFGGFCGFWPYCSCPNDLVTSIMAPAHPHATGVAVYPALFSTELVSSLDDLDTVSRASIFTSFFCPRRLGSKSINQIIVKIVIKMCVKNCHSSFTEKYTRWNHRQHRASALGLFNREHLNISSKLNRNTSKTRRSISFTINTKNIEWQLYAE